MGSSSGFSVELPSSSISCSSLHHAHGSGGGSDVGAARNVADPRPHARTSTRRIPGERVEGPSEHGALFLLVLVPIVALALHAHHARFGDLDPQLFPYGGERVIVFSVGESGGLVEPVTSVWDLPRAASAERSSAGDARGTSP